MKPACADVLTTLRANRVDAIVVGGVALAEDAYADWALRHCHDLDLLLAPGDLERAIAALALPPTRRRAGTAELVHPSGMSISLHTRAYCDPYYCTVAGDPERQLSITDIAGAPATMLDPAGVLIRTCVHAACVGRPSLRWAIDAWVVIHRHPDLDWSALFDRAHGDGAGLALLVRLRWLSDALGADIPADVLAELAGETDLLTAEVLLHQARRDVGTRTLLRCISGNRARARMVRRLAVPSEAYLRLRAPSANDRSPAALRVARARRYGVARVRGLASRIPTR
jgi:hypothetical protein